MNLCSACQDITWEFKKDNFHIYTFFKLKMNIIVNGQGHLIKKGFTIECEMSSECTNVNSHTMNWDRDISSSVQTHWKKRIHKPFFFLHKKSSRIQANWIKLEEFRDWIDNCILVVFSCSGLQLALDFGHVYVYVLLIIWKWVEYYIKMFAYIFCVLFFYSLILC